MRRFAFPLMAGILLLTAPNVRSQETDRPNVLFLAVDDMNDWIGCLAGTEPSAGPRAITPNLDKLAARGVAFSNAHTAGVFCAPSRAAIFSGQYASTTGCYETPYFFVHRPETESLQMSFAKAGYTTLGAGKLFHHPVGAVDQRGWTEFFLRTKRQRESGWALESWSEETPFPEKFPASVYNEGEAVTGGLFLEWAAIPDEKEEEMADTMRVNWAVEQLRKEHDKPFFLACGIYAPHYPHYCPRKYFDLYDPAEIELPPMKRDDLEDLPERVRKSKMARSRILEKLEDLEAHDDAIHGYLACISYADSMMGRILDALEASPYHDNTIVVLWSDHGYHLGEKRNWGKHTLWERTSNVPFLWAGPGVKEGALSDVTVSLIDMYPTFVEMCGLPEPAQELEGTSLAATLADPAKAKDRDVFLPHNRRGEFAMINRDWRYIRYEDGEELYDLRSDPNEWHNLASRPEHAGLIEAMRSLAPETFAEPEERLNARKDLVVEGAGFRWEKGRGNAMPKPGYVPPHGDTAKSSGNAGGPGANLLRDGSFEGMEGRGPAWKFTEGAYEVTSGEKFHGEKSLTWTGAVERGGPARQRVSIEPGQTYEISYRIRFAPGTTGRVVCDTLDRFDDTAQAVMDASKAGKWFSFSRRFESGEHRDVMIRFFPGREFSGRFYVDDVRMVKLSGEGELGVPR